MGLLTQYTAKDIVNLGLGKIAASQISTLDNGSSQLERFCAQGYTHWKRSELEKRRWVFATTVEKLTQDGDVLPETYAPNVFRFAIPGDLIRPIRQKSDTWTQRGKYVYAPAEIAWLEYVRMADEQEFPPSFVEVLACRIALECAEYVTQSNTKKADAHSLYKEAVNDAGRQNAFILGHEDISTPDEDSDWLRGRYG